MTRWLLQAAVVGALASVAPAVADAQFYQLSPMSTFLRAESGDVAHSPVIVDLSGLAAGTALNLTTGSSLFRYTIYADPTELHNAPYMGVFSASMSLLASTLQHRVPDAIAPGGYPPFTTGPTLFQGLDTDIAEDFLLWGAPGSQFTLFKPDGANYLFLGLTDSWYMDNEATDPSNFGLSVTWEGATDPTVTPEPVSMALLGTGLVGLGAARRRRRTADLAG